MVYRPNFGTFINANQTAKQTPVSALSKVNVRELVIYLQDEIENVNAEVVSVANGLINAIELVKDKNTKEPLDYTKRTGYQIYKKALQKGVILRPLGDVIYFNPPLIIEKSDMDFVVDVALECTKEILK